MKYPLRIHTDSLPGKLRKQLIGYADKDGYIHGYFAYSDRDHMATFFSDRPLFTCARPTTVVETHLIRRMYAAVSVGHHASGRPVLEVAEIIAHYNGMDP